LVLLRKPLFGLQKRRKQPERHMNRITLKDIVRTALEERYVKAAPVYEQYLNDFSAKMLALLKETHIRFTLKQRLKHFDSLFGKILRKAKELNSNPARPAESERETSVLITDFIGLRIICPFGEDTVRVEDIIRDRFEVVERERKGLVTILLRKIAARPCVLAGRNFAWSLTCVYAGGFQGPGCRGGQQPGGLRPASCPQGLVVMDTLPRAFAGACKIIARPYSLDCSGKPGFFARARAKKCAQNLKNTFTVTIVPGCVRVSRARTTMRHNFPRFRRNGDTFDSP
jgi:hypothetical protein